MTFKDWWATQEWPNDRRIEEFKRVAKAAWKASRYNLQTQGQDEPCFYCGERCDGYAGNPSKWPLMFCQPDETGKPKAHHTGCVINLLEGYKKVSKQFADMHAYARFLEKKYNHK